MPSAIKRVALTLPESKIDVVDVNEEIQEIPPPVRKSPDRKIQTNSNHLTNEQKSTNVDAIVTRISANLRRSDGPRSVVLSPLSSIADSPPSSKKRRLLTAEVEKDDDNADSDVEAIHSVKKVDNARQGKADNIQSGVFSPLWLTVN